MAGRGGPRNYPKPYVDSGLLYKALAAHEELVANLGSYEHLSRSNAPCPAGLVKCLPLWRAFVKIEKSADVHSNPLRVALISLLAERPHLNQSGQSGQVWANLRTERIICLLNHVRAMSRQDSLMTAASRLNKEDFLSLQEALKMVASPSEALEKAPDPALEKAPDPALEKAPGPDLEKSKALEKSQALEKAAASRVLKKTDSNSSAVSMDAKGFPNMFGSSPECPKTPAAASELPLMSTRRPGSRVQQDTAALEKAMGYGACSKKKPAAALEKAQPKKKPAKALEKVKKGKPKAKKHVPPLEKGVRKKWLKLQVTSANKPKPRSYLTGTTEEGGKLKLIVEVASTMSPHFAQIIDDIKKSLEKDSLTKQEALDMRAELVEAYAAK